MKFFGKTFKLAFLFIFLAEILSVFGYLLPVFNKLTFLTVVIIIFIISFYKLEYGILILLAELFIGSKGYLFYYQQDGMIISIRIALWLVIMSVFFGKFIYESVKNKKVNFKFLNTEFSKYFYLLFFFIILGAWRGFIIGNNPDNLFFDLNGWLYFGLLFPILYILRSNNKEPSSLSVKELGSLLLQIFTASLAWLCFKTFFLLFAFSHNLTGMIYELYRWVRTSGVGEITLVQGGFYRVFFQSHIFVLIGFLIFLAYAVSKTENVPNFKNIFKNRELIYLFGFLTVLMSINLLTFSRSNWLGMFFGLVFILACWLFKKNWRAFIYAVTAVFITAILSLGLIVLIVKFPFPNPLGGFSTTDLFSERASALTGEAGASSRWSLLPELWNKIKKSPLVGYGFGATVTYKTSDPRILETDSSGLYTTYAFEWGFLDIWLKLGIFGLLSYLLLLYIIISKSLKNSNWLNLGLAAGIIALFFVHIFSPYLNHPLGIGYLLIASVLIAKNHKS